MDRLSHLIFLFCFFPLLLVSCGGGGSSSSSTSGPTPPTSGPTPTPPTLSADVNGGLKGRVFRGDTGQVLDLATGTYTAVAREDSVVTSIADGSEYLETVQGCKSSGILEQYDCIILRNESGEKITEIMLRSKFFNGALLSPDKQMIAVEWADEENEGSLAERRLALFNRDGQLLRRSSDVTNGFVWLDKGSLAYISGSSLYLTSVDTLEGELIREFTPLEGSPAFLSASPDGSQLAFTLVIDPLLGSTPKGHVWVMNIDGTSLRQLTTNGVNRDPNAIESVWSYDGEWILVLANHVSTTAVSIEGASGEVFAVPANGNEVLLEDSSSSTAQLVYAYRSSPTSLLPISSLGSRVRKMSWVPEQVKIEESGQALLSNAAGTIYSMSGETNNDLFDNEIRALNVNTGVISTLVSLPSVEYGSSGHLDVARDEQTISYSSSRNQQEFIQFFSNTSAVPLVGSTILPSPLLGDGFDIKGSVKLSPMDSDEVAYAFDFTQDDNTVMAVTKINRITPNNDDTTVTYLDYVYVDFLSDGRVVLAHKDGGIYISNGQSSETTLLFETSEAVNHFSAHPNEDRLVLSMRGRTWVSDLNGDNLTQVTVSAGFEDRQVWSPDGNYLLVAVYDNDSQPLSTEQGALYVVPADSKNIRLDLRAVNVSNNALSLRDNGTLFFTKGLAAWR